MSNFTSHIKTSSNSLGFAKIIGSKSALVYDLRITIDGIKKFFIVKIKSTHHQAFLQALKKNAGFDLADFGTIIYSGRNEPSEQIKAILREKYDMYK